ncbi:hypothetical protein ACTXT7_012297 [Hymenolepis weldensis]
MVEKRNKIEIAKIVALADLRLLKIGDESQFLKNYRLSPPSMRQMTQVPYEPPYPGRKSHASRDIIAQV